jgi:hypothetical protein
MPSETHESVKNTASRDELELSPWLPLLQRLTAASPTWGVWKNADDAISGRGDIDSAGDPADWPLIESHFRLWASSQELEPVFICTHIPGGINMIATPPRLETFLEFSVKERKVFRGSSLFKWHELVPLMEMDPRGFRRLRPGTEGLLKLLLNGSTRTGRRNHVGLERKQVLELLRQDPVGVELGSRIFGPARGDVLRAARSAVDGGWDRRSLIAAGAWAVLRAAVEPMTFASRIRFLLVSRRSCPVLIAMFQGHRRVPRARREWLESVAEAHPRAHGRPGDIVE